MKKPILKGLISYDVAKEQDDIWNIVLVDSFTYFAVSCVLPSLGWRTRWVDPALGWQSDSQGFIDTVRDNAIYQWGDLMRLDDLLQKLDTMNGHLETIASKDIGTIFDDGQGGNYLAGISDAITAIDPNASLININSTLTDGLLEIDDTLLLLVQQVAQGFGALSGLVSSVGSLETSIHNDYTAFSILISPLVTELSKLTDRINPDGVSLGEVIQGVLKDGEGVNYGELLRDLSYFQQLANCVCDLNQFYQNTYKLAFEFTDEDDNPQYQSQSKCIISRRIVGGWYAELASVKNAYRIPDAGYATMAELMGIFRPEVQAIFKAQYQFLRALFEGVGVDPYTGTNLFGLRAESEYDTLLSNMEAVKEDILGAVYSSCTPLDAKVAIDLVLDAQSWPTWMVDNMKQSLELDRLIAGFNGTLTVQADGGTDFAEVINSDCSQYAYDCLDCPPFIDEFIAGFAVDEVYNDITGFNYDQQLTVQGADTTGFPGIYSPYFIQMSFAIPTVVTVEHINNAVGGSIGRIYTEDSSCIGNVEREYFTNNDLPFTTGPVSYFEISTYYPNYTYEVEITIHDPNT